MVGLDPQAVAQQGRVAQLGHQRHRELVERVGEDHHLEARTQPIQEVGSTLHGTHRSDDLLDQFEPDAVGVEDAQAVPHQLVVVGDVTGGEP